MYEMIERLRKICAVGKTVVDHFICVRTSRPYNKKRVLSDSPCETSEKNKI